MPDYTSTPSIGQLHGNSCWAASLAWFLKQDTGGRPSWSQKQIMEIYWRSTREDGSLIGDYLATLWSQDQRLRMSTRVHPTPDPELYSLPLGTKPVCIAFKHITGYAHMNVIWSLGGDDVMCMEPYWPFPGTDGKRTGRFVQRKLEHFNYGDNVVLAWANPPDKASTATPAEAG
ncbi:hypothetical protein [Roseococcus sp. YIM B11640]|uniref:hypothetical protein n=1 Tax=Roseococcus sp. YIM B11640 TaxID=3133973 RepID=UPI003C7D9F45